jgi:hypothetical protein
MQWKSILVAIAASGWFFPLSCTTSLYAGVRVVSAIGLSLLVSCSQTPVDETCTVYSDSWFTCEAHLECVAVFDAFCRWTAVNSKNALDYQAWTRREVTDAGERALQVSIQARVVCRRSG